MTVDNLPSLRPPEFGEVRDAGRPILSYPWRSDGPHRVPPHSHARGHILHLEDGAYWVITAEARWLAATGHAIWIPPHVRHEVYSQGPVAAKVLFVDEAHAGSLPHRCGTLKVSGLLSELFRRAVEYENDYGTGGPEARLAGVLLDELAHAELTPLMLPISKEPRLALAMHCVIDDPSRHRDLGTIAKMAGASPRTLARLFAGETGLTFTQWKTRFVLIEAIDRLARGATVTQVAVDLGYSPSSFAYVFRTNLGVRPGHYAVAGRKGARTRASARRGSARHRR
ncbi:MAG: helix-turn-helix transcriptional regulator [Vicinamibacterales bacterium]